MRERLLAWLACPLCRGDLALVEPRGRSDEIHAGRLDCGGCGARYPIAGGIPRLLPGPASGEAEATARRFAYEWTRFPEIRPQYREQFLGWIAPATPEGFRGRRVLDAGCGKGRHLRLAASFGAAEVIGLELGGAVEVAARNVADLPQVHVIQGDLTRPPLRAGTLDLVYSIGVLHHLGEPRTGFQALSPLLAAGGLLLAWVYAREGNGWVLALVDPARRVARRLPLPLVNAVAGLLTVPLWAALRSLYGPARSRPGLARWLPYRDYLLDLVPFPFAEVHSIAFDQLLAPVAHYMPRQDVERCARAAGLGIRSLRFHHRNSWSLQAAPAPAALPAR
jgi:SAM-dependent methyltransferase